MYKVKSLIGIKFGKLTVVRRAEKNYVTPSSGNSEPRWFCKCDCGKTTTLKGSSLKTGHTKSCGCLSVESATTHGLHKHPIYQTWRSMLNRCYNPKCERYPVYGGRGITVCDRWKNSLENFIADIPKRPSKLHSIDRINNDLPYQPGNVKWSTAQEQASNKSNNVWIEFRGFKKTRSEWERFLGLKRARLFYEITFRRRLELESRRNAGHGFFRTVFPALTLWPVFLLSCKIIVGRLKQAEWHRQSIFSATRHLSSCKSFWRRLCGVRFPARSLHCQERRNPVRVNGWIYRPNFSRLTRRLTVEMAFVASRKSRRISPDAVRFHRGDLRFHEQPFTHRADCTGTPLAVFYVGCPKHRQGNPQLHRQARKLQRGISNEYNAD